MHCVLLNRSYQRGHRHQNARLYVVCTDLEPLRLYIYDEAMLYFAGERYDRADTETLSSHITNRGYTDRPAAFPTSIEWEGYADAEEVDQSTRTLSAFLKFLRAEGYDADQLWADIKLVVVKTFAAVLPQLRRSWKQLAPKPRARHLLPRITGLDVHLSVQPDGSLKPWLLEVNPNPALGIF